MAKASDYGAIADGSTNCARAINLCLHETGVVEFDEGTYIIGGTGVTTPVSSIHSARLIAAIAPAGADAAHGAGGVGAADRTGRGFGRWLARCSHRSTIGSALGGSLGQRTQSSLD